MLRIRVLGELSVETSGRQIELSGSWRARSLLAWFALNPGAHRRGDVASRFWPDILDSSARASLRNALWALRRALRDEAGGALIAAYVCSLRKKLAWFGGRFGIQTVRAVGYRFVM